MDHDVGCYDLDGNVFILGRVSELIKYKSNYVFKFILGCPIQDRAAEDPPPCGERCGAQVEQDIKDVYIIQ